MIVTKRGCKNSCRSEFGSFFFASSQEQFTYRWILIYDVVRATRVPNVRKEIKIMCVSACICTFVFICVCVCECVFVCVFVCVSGCMNVSACLSILTKKYMMQTKCAKSRKIKIHKTNKNPVRTVFTGDNKASINVVITLIVRFYAWGTFINPLLILLDPPFPLPMY